VVTAAYVVLVLAVAVQRLVEVRISRRHVRALKARGAIEHAPHQVPFMVALHTLWLAACVAEPLLWDRPIVPVVAGVSLLMLLAGQVLRWSARRALGPRWTVPIVTLPGAPRVTTGPFRYLNHPNYLGVVIEIAALPLVHTAWFTAGVFTLANALMLTWRIAAEEQELRSPAGSPADIR
jgi:methyltransferase